MRIPITAVVLSFNSSRTIHETLDCLQFCGEVIVLDSGSCDETQIIASRYLNVRWVARSACLNFANVRNEADQLALHEWILHIDSDESIDEEMRDGIVRVATSDPLSEVHVWRAKRIDVFWGQKVKHGEVHHAYARGIKRLYRRGSGEWRGSVHEEYITSKDSCALPGCMYHKSHPNLVSFLKKINTYSTIRSEELARKNVSRPLLVIQMMLYPFCKFWYTYLLRAGFRDGPAGFVYSFMMSFHSFLVRAKLLTHPYDR
jgi:glycosyltransferase involved in cell wall biosynthesis